MFFTFRVYETQADELVLALKDLFEIVLANKQKEMEEQKKRMEETTVYLQPSYDNPLGSAAPKTAEENVYSVSADFNGSFFFRFASVFTSVFTSVLTLLCTCTYVL